MKNMLKATILEELFYSRRKDFFRNIVNQSKEYKALINAVEDEIRQLLLYVPGEHYEALEKEMDKFLSRYILKLEKFWNLEYYKIGFADGLRVKKEVELSLEELTNE